MGKPAAAADKFLLHHCQMHGWAAEGSCSEFQEHKGDLAEGCVPYFTAVALKSLGHDSLALEAESESEGIPAWEPQQLGRIIHALDDHALKDRSCAANFAFTLP